MLTLVGLKRTERLQERSNIMPMMMSANALDDKTPEEILEEYRKNIANVDAYASVISNMNLTIYGTTPTWYNSTFKSNFVKAKADSQTWLNNILSLLSVVPNSIVDYDNLYQMYADEILDCCREITIKYNENLQNQIITDIERLYNDVNKRISQVSSLENKIDDYIHSMEEDLKFFNSTLADACQSQKAEMSKLKNLQETKQQLEKEIAHLSDVVTGTGIAGGVTLAAVPFGFFFGPVGILIGIVVAAAAISLLLTAIIENAVCNQKRRELDACINSMNDETKTIESLDSFVSNLKSIINSAGVAKSAAIEIRGYWSALQTELDDVLKKLKDGEEDAKRKLYNTLKDEIEKSEEIWNKIVDTAKLYAQVDINVEKEVIRVSDVA